MTTELLERARTGLEAWLRGDVDALAPLLDPEVELLWWEPGEWDCHGREAVLSLLRRRKSEGAGTDEVELFDAGGGRIIAGRSPSPDDAEAGMVPTTLITFRDGRAIQMRQFRRREEALAAALESR